MSGFLGRPDKPPARFFRRLGSKSGRDAVGAVDENLAFLGVYLARLRMSYALHDILLRVENRPDLRAFRRTTRKKPVQRPGALVPVVSDLCQCVHFGIIIS